MFSIDIFLLVIVFGFVFVGFVYVVFGGLCVVVVLDIYSGVGFFGLGLVVVFLVF